MNTGGEQVPEKIGGSTWPRGAWRRGGQRDREKIDGEETAEREKNRRKKISKVTISYQKLRPVKGWLLSYPGRFLYQFSRPLLKIGCSAFSACNGHSACMDCADCADFA